MRFVSTPNRTLCDVLEDMRKYTKTIGLTTNQTQIVSSLIEELQILGNRMEAGLWDQKDIKDLYEERSKLKKQVKKLKKKKDKLKGEDDE